MQLKIRALALLLILGAALEWPAAALAASGQITQLSGALLARRPDGNTRFLSARSFVDEGDTLATSDNSYARIRFNDGADVVMRPNSQLRIDKYKYEALAPEHDGMVLSLIKGGLRSITGLLGKRNPRTFQLNTATATVGIRGTVFGSQICNNDCGGLNTPNGKPLENGLHVDVSDGRIVVTTNAGSRELGVGEFGFVAGLNVLPVPVPSAEGFRVQAVQQVLAQSLFGTNGAPGAPKSECEVR